MKSKTSLFNRAIWKRNFRSYWVLLLGLLLTFCGFLVLPLYLNMQNGTRQYEHWNGPGNLKDILYGYFCDSLDMATFMLFIIMMVAVLVAMALFSYLFQARNTNMLHTFPVDRKSLFCTNYVTGLMFLFLPIVVSILGMKLVCMAFHVPTGGALFHWMYFMFGEAFFFFNFALCVVMFVGRQLAVPVIYGILNFLYLGFYMVFQEIVSLVSYGLTSMSFGSASSYLSPLASMIDIGLSIDREKATYKIYGLNVLLLYVAVGVVLGAIALLAYEKKHVETAGDLLTVRWLKPIFRWGFAFLVASYGALLVENMTAQGNNEFGSGALLFLLVLVVAIGFLAFYGAQMMLERTFRVFRRRVFYEFAAYTVCICALYLGMAADPFGLINWVPKISELAGAQIECSALMYDSGLFTDSAKELEVITDIHREILSHREELWGNGFDNHVRITYVKKDGEQVERYYRLPDNASAQEILKKVEQFGYEPKHLRQMLFGMNPDTLKILGGDLDIGPEMRTLTEKNAEKLYKAFLADIDEGNINPAETGDVWSLFLNCLDTKGYLSSSDRLYELSMRLSGTRYESSIRHQFTGYCYITPTCKHVLRALEEMKITLEEHVS